DARDRDRGRGSWKGQARALRPGLRSRDGLRQSGDLLCQSRIARGRPAQAVAQGILRRARFACGRLGAPAPAAVPAAGLPPRFSYRAVGTFVLLTHALPSCSLFVPPTNRGFGKRNFSSEIFHVNAANDLSGLRVSSFSQGSDDMLYLQTAVKKERMRSSPPMVHRSP